MRRRRGTLAEKNIQNDIDRDNSRLLQSIRFFVENIDDLRKYAVAQERSQELNREYLKRLKMFSFVDDPVKRTKNSIVKKQVIEEVEEEMCFIRGGRGKTRRRRRSEGK